ncbi:hypothetical protein Q7P36_011299 [Cladosporium allicinum]
MSSEQSSSTSDLRSASRDSKRDATRKHKWGMGALETRGRGVGNVRPLRPSDTANKTNPRFQLGISHPINHSRVTRKHDMLEGNTSDEASSNNSASDFSDGTPSPPADVDITYSFDASRGPTQGNQIFNVALAQAVEKFEERETVKLVKNEYDVLDADGESVAAPARKTQAKARGMGATRVPDADEDYEFV